MPASDGWVASCEPAVRLLIADRNAMARSMRPFWTRRSISLKLGSVGFVSVVLLMVKIPSCHPVFVIVLFRGVAVLLIGRYG